MNKLESYYENINPKLTPEELTERVTEMSGEKKTKVHRKSLKFVGVIAAAAAVLSLGITSAANGWSYADIFRNIFGEKADSLSDNIVEEAQVTADSTKKMDFQLVAAAADSNSILMIVDVTAKNGFKLGQNHIGDARADVDYNVEVETHGGFSSESKVISGDENKARLRIQMESSRDITGKDVTLTIWEYTDEKPEDVDISEIHHYIYSDDNGERVYRYRDTETKWQVKFTAEGESRDYELDHGVTLSLSPISVSFSGRSVPVISTSTLTLVTKDGEEIKVQYPSTGGERSAVSQFVRANFTFYEPINLDEIKEIKLDNRTIIEF